MPTNQKRRSTDFLLEDFKQQDPWRMFRIMAEFVDGFEALADCNPAVSIFGSARVTPDHADYQKAEAIARQRAREGFSIITGGGPGAMEAANRGAFAGRSRPAKVLTVSSDPPPARLVSRESGPRPSVTAVPDG